MSEIKSRRPPNLVKEKRDKKEASFLPLIPPLDFNQIPKTPIRPQKSPPRTTSPRPKVAPSLGTSFDVSFLSDRPGHGIHPIAKEPGGPKPFMDVPIKQSRIPEEDHIIEHHPAIEAPPDSGQYTFRFNESLNQWDVQVFPAARPSGRRDAILLGEWLNKKLDTSKKKVKAEKATASVPEVLSLALNDANEIYSTCMDEIIRQVHVGCAERGDLLARVWQFYQHMIGRMQKIFDKRTAQHCREVKKLETKLEELMEALRQSSQNKQLLEAKISNMRDQILHANTEIEERDALLGQIDRFRKLYEEQKKRVEEVMADRDRQIAQREALEKERLSTLVEQKQNLYRETQHLISQVKKFTAENDLVMRENEELHNMVMNEQSKSQMERDAYDDLNRQHSMLKLQIEEALKAKNELERAQTTLETAKNKFREDLFKVQSEKSLLISETNGKIARLESTKEALEEELKQSEHNQLLLRREIHYEVQHSTRSKQKEIGDLRFQLEEAKREANEIRSNHSSILLQLKKKDGELLAAQSRLQEGKFKDSLAEKWKTVKSSGDENPQAARNEITRVQQYVAEIRREAEREMAQRQSEHKTRIEEEVQKARESLAMELNLERSAFMKSLQKDAAIKMSKLKAQQRVQGSVFMKQESVAQMRSQRLVAEKAFERFENELMFHHDPLYIKKKEENLIRSATSANLLKEKIAIPLNMGKRVSLVSALDPNYLESTEATAFRSRLEELQDSIDQLKTKKSVDPKLIESLQSKAEVLRLRTEAAEQQSRIQKLEKMLSGETRRSEEAIMQAEMADGVSEEEQKKRKWIESQYSEALRKSKQMQEDLTRLQTEPIGLRTPPSIRSSNVSPSPSLPSPRIARSSTTSMNDSLSDLAALVNDALLRTEKKLPQSLSGFGHSVSSGALLRERSTSMLSESSVQFTTTSSVNEEETDQQLPEPPSPKPKRRKSRKKTQSVMLSQSDLLEEKEKEKESLRWEKEEKEKELVQKKQMVSKLETDIGRLRVEAELEKDSLIRENSALKEKMESVLGNEEERIADKLKMQELVLENLSLKNLLKQFSSDNEKPKAVQTKTESAEKPAKTIAKIPSQPVLHRKSSSTKISKLSEELGEAHAEKQKLVLENIALKQKIRDSTPNFEPSVTSARKNSIVEEKPVPNHRIRRGSVVVSDAVSKHLGSRSPELSMKVGGTKLKQEEKEVPLKKVVNCTLCDPGIDVDKTARHHCKNCNAELCDSHLETHKRTSDTKTHSIVSSSEVKSAQSPPKSPIERKQTPPRPRRQDTITHVGALTKTSTGAGDIDNMWASEEKNDLMNEAKAIRVTIDKASKIGTRSPPQKTIISTSTTKREKERKDSITKTPKVPAPIRTEAVESDGSSHIEKSMAYKRIRSFLLRCSWSLPNSITALGSIPASFTQKSPQKWKRGDVVAPSDTHIGFAKRGIVVVGGVGPGSKWDRLPEDADLESLALSKSEADYFAWRIFAAKIQSDDKAIRDGLFAPGFISVFVDWSIEEYGSSVAIENAVELATAEKQHLRSMRYMAVKRALTDVLRHSMARKSVLVHCLWRCLLQKGYPDHMSIETANLLVYLLKLCLPAEDRESPSGRKPFPLFVSYVQAQEIMGAIFPFDDPETNRHRVRKAALHGSTTVTTDSLITYVLEEWQVESKSVQFQLRGLYRGSRVFGVLPQSLGTQRDFYIPPIVPPSTSISSEWRQKVKSECSNNLKTDSGLLLQEFITLYRCIVPRVKKRQAAAVFHRFARNGDDPYVPEHVFLDLCHNSGIFSWSRRKKLFGGDFSQKTLAKQFRKVLPKQLDTVVIGSSSRSDVECIGLGDDCSACLVHRFERAHSLVNTTGSEAETGLCIHVLTKAMNLRNAAPKMTRSKSNRKSLNTKPKKLKKSRTVHESAIPPSPPPRTAVDELDAPPPPLPDEVRTKISAVMSYAPIGSTLSTIPQSPRVRIKPVPKEGNSIYLPPIPGAGELVRKPIRPEYAETSMPGSPRTNETPVTRRERARGGVKRYINL